jgi:hypothetical protein
MKQQIETAQDAGVPDEHRVGIESSSLPSVLATMRAFRLSVAVLDS